MHILRTQSVVAVLVTSAALLTPLGLSAEADGEKAYQACAACHLPDGKGIVGAFPPIVGRINTIASLEGGRAYLIQAVSAGISGNIQVGTQTFAGVMPGHAGTMDTATIAAALNHALSLQGDAAEVDAFTADEVAKVQGTIEGKTMNDTAALRAELVSKHGDEWP